MSVNLASPAAADDSAATHFAIAKLLADEGQFETARERFEQAIGLAPDEEVLRIEYAEFLFRFRRTTESMAQIAEARRLAPENPAVLRTFGQIYLSSGAPTPSQRAEAVEALEALRKVEPNNLMGMVSLAQAYEGARRVGDAADVIGELVGHHNENDRLKRYWIDLLKRAGRGQEATEVLREVVRLEQESIESRKELADREAGEGNFTAAIELLTEVRQVQDSEEVVRRLAENYLSRSQSPGLADSQRQADLDTARGLEKEMSPAEALGVEARILGLTDKATEAIDLLAAGPKESVADVSNLLLLAQLLEQAGRFDEAGSAYERASELLPERQRLGVLRQRILLSARSGKWQDVEQRTARIVEGSEPSSYPAMRALRIEALVRLDRFDDALSLLRKEGGETPTPENLMSRAEVLAAQKKPKLTRKALERIEPGDPSLDQRRADVFISLGDLDAAVEVVNGLVGEADYASLLAAGQFLSRDGLYDRAQSFLERALDTDDVAQDDSLRANVSFLLGQALERQGEVSQAAERFRAVLAIRADDPLALNYLGYMLADAGQDIEEALALIGRAVEIDPDNGAYHDSLGWAQFRLADFQAAAESLERATELSPGSSTIYDHLGDTYRALERYQDARAAYTSALSYATGDEAAQVRKKIAQLPSHPAP